MINPIETLYTDNAETWASLLRVPKIRILTEPCGPRARRAPSYSVLMASDREVEPIILDRFENEPWQLEPGELSAGPVTKIIREELRHHGRPSHWKYTARREWAIEESLLA